MNAMIHHRDLLQQIVGISGGFGVLTAFYWAIARFWPSVPGQRIFRKGYLTDCLYWLWTPMVTKAVTPIAIAIAVLPLVALFGLHFQTLTQGHGIRPPSRCGCRASRSS